MELIDRTVPYEAREALELIARVFGPEEAELEACQLDGSECAFNTDIVCEGRADGALVGMIHATIPEGAPTICGLSAMCTDPRQRGAGLGRQLFESMVRNMEHRGVETMFLGTSNPAAAKLYRSAGFSYLFGSGVMVRCRQGDVTDFAKTMFTEKTGQLRLVPGSAAMRIPMIPFLVLGGAQQVLDVNTELFGSGFVTQRSCMGLYRRYQELEEKGGTYWAAVNACGIPCAMLSLLPTQAGLRVDLCACANVYDALPELFCGLLPTDGSAYMQVADTDREKQCVARQLGFREERTASVLQKCGNIWLPFSVYRR